MDATELAAGWGRAIKAQRKHLGMSQDELATILRVSQGTVSKWERGESMPSHKYIPAIAAALDTVPSVLFQYPQQQSVA